MEGVCFTDDRTYVREYYISGENMKKTFNQCLYAITGEEFNPKDWTNGTRDINDDDDDHYCICGHKIHKLYYIQYIPTGIQVQVGKDCVEKIDEKLYKRITSDKFCLECDEPIGKQSKIHKQGFCSEDCSNTVYSSKCDVILLWADNKNPYFNKSFIQSVMNQYSIKNTFSVKQKKSIDNIIDKFKIPYDGNCDSCRNTGIAYWSDDVYGCCFECSKYDNFIRK